MSSTPSSVAQVLGIPRDASIAPRSSQQKAGSRRPQNIGPIDVPPTLSRSATLLTADSSIHRSRRHMRFRDRHLQLVQSAYPLRNLVSWHPPVKARFQFRERFRQESLASLAGRPPHRLEYGAITRSDAGAGAAPLRSREGHAAPARSLAGRQRRPAPVDRVRRDRPHAEPGATAAARQSGRSDPLLPQHRGCPTGPVVDRRALPIAPDPSVHRRRSGGRAGQSSAADPRPHPLATITALKSLGFNVNFAPVLDLSGPDPKNGIGDRAFGDDPRRVVDLASIALRVHLRAGVIPVGKHFPGLGSARADTHRTLPVIRRSRPLLWRRDLLPYRRLKRFLPIIMVGHAYYPALQGRRPLPATLARTVVEGLLRKRIGHQGLILTDDLEMGAIDQRLDGAEQARAALGAGSDGLMFCRSEARILEAREGLLRGLESGEIRGARIEASLRRVLALKLRYLTTRRR